MQMPDYKERSYAELQARCKKLALGGKGSRESLVNKLVEYDLANGIGTAEAVDISDIPEAQPTPIAPVVQPGPPIPKGLKATDPNPDNPNWDMAGRWIRRPTPKHKSKGL